MSAECLSVFYKCGECISAVGHTQVIIRNCWQTCRVGSDRHWAYCVAVGCVAGLYKLAAQVAIICSQGKPASETVCPAYHESDWTTLKVAL